MVGKLFVSNIPWKATEEQMRDLFEEAGKVFSVKIIYDKQTGHSRGFGFVEMADADQAIEKLNGKFLMERPLTVVKARGSENENNSTGS